MATIAGSIGIDERVGRLAPIEAAMLAWLESKPLAPVIRITTQSRYERDVAEIDAERKEFIERRTAELLSNRESFGNLLFEVTGGAAAEMAIVALRDAYEEQGQCWDGISAFGDLMHGAARAQAASEWPAKLRESAPPCSDCHHGAEVRDAYGTGDSPTLYECKPLAGCPWGKTL